MAHDQLEEQAQTTRPRRDGRGGGRLVIAGVVGACAMGVGLGLWARPSALERGDAPTTPKPEIEAALSPDRRLQIIVDDSPAPIGPLLEVMPADTPGLVLEMPAEAQPTPAAPALPSGPPVGLMKVAAPVVAIPAAVAVARSEPAPLPPPASRKAEPAATEKPKAKPVVARARVAKVEAVEKAEPAPKKVATADKPAKKGKAAGETAAARKKDRDVKLAKSEPKGKTKATTGETPEAKKPAKLTKLVKAVKTAPKTIKAKTSAVAERKRQREVELAEAKRAQAKAEKLRADKAAKANAKAVQLAQVKAEKAKAEKARIARASAAKKTIAPRGEGPMRVARANPCASLDVGEALVCADPRLNQRDRQLQRAFRDAEAAGVPASALNRQQERWRQARAAAARDGSWAVEDVYEARIAELNDLARDAREY